MPIQVVRVVPPVILAQEFVNQRRRDLVKGRVVHQTARRVRTGLCALEQVVQKHANLVLL